MRKFDIEIFTRSGLRDMEGDTVRRSEIIAVLSLASDLAIGQPVEFAFRSCGLSVAFAEALGLGSDEVREVYYQSLLRYIGCNADTYALAAILGDEMELRRDFALIDMSRGNEVAAVVLRALRRANAHRSIANYALAIIKGMIESRASYNILAGHCEVAERLVTRLGFDAAVARNVGQLYERWDGKGLPHGLKGEAIAPLCVSSPWCRTRSC